MGDVNAKGQPSFATRPPWYVAPALERRRLQLALAGLCAVAVAACGGGERQDEDEPEGDFRVEVANAPFPGKQAVAKSSELVITVRNRESDKTIPNVAVSVKGFDTQLDNPDLADPNRPVFVINGVPEDIGSLPESKEAAPKGGETAYVNTWALGPLRPGQSKTFRWSVTAVRPGAYDVSYRWPPLSGKAKAVGPGGQAPAGLVQGERGARHPERPRGRRRPDRSHRVAPPSLSRSSNPAHRSTGTRGYRG